MVEDLPKAVVEKLVEAGLVDASGNNKVRFYILNSEVYKEQDNIVGHVRQTGIAAVKYEAWIMELIQKQNGKITRDNVVELLNVTPLQVYCLLKKYLIRVVLSLLEMDGWHIMS
ncbi:hypothetical protein [Butyrivibrio sp. TB]|uniref:hypothetical protein n=1 Tax=Butyrivibrio sp. TB TaxID=1520809 RepID=UPI0008CB6749|nr:hypothetical protein [Butyrivibrio sp. TB]SEQ64867.1 ATP-dependent DNA helicase RecG [Butyrivibrio sp. TB]